MIEITLKVLAVLGILFACFAIPLMIVAIWEALVKLHKRFKKKRNQTHENNI